MMAQLDHGVRQFVEVREVVIVVGVVRRREGGGMVMVMALP